MPSNFHLNEERSLASDNAKANSLGGELLSLETAVELADSVMLGLFARKCSHV